MDMSPLSATSQERRESQCVAGMTHLNAEISNRKLWRPCTLPNEQATRDNWNATHVSTHGSLFPSNDNLTTVMFIGAGDPREAQRERLTSSLFSPVNVTAYTLEAVKTVFVELFCSSKSSMENPSLFVSGHDGSTNRTFIVEDYPEDEYGQWASDEVTGEQGYIDDERSCFWTWDDTEYSWQSDHLKVVK